MKKITIELSDEEWEYIANLARLRREDPQKFIIDEIRGFLWDIIFDPEGSASVLLNAKEILSKYEIQRPDLGGK